MERGEGIIKLTKQEDMNMVRYAAEALKIKIQTA